MRKAGLAPVLSGSGGFAIGGDEPHLLFAYGTLAPPDSETAAREGWSADTIRGRLFDLGTYPALVDLDDPGARWVEGFVRPVNESELRDRLDPYEGVAEGLYRRSVAQTGAGRAVWVYVYARPLPPDARGPLVRWDGPRGRYGPAPARENHDDGPDRDLRP